MTIHESELDLDLELDDSSLELTVSDSTRTRYTSRLPLSAEPAPDDAEPLSPEDALALLEQLIGEDPGTSTQSSSSVKLYRSTERMARIAESSADDPIRIESQLQLDLE